MLNTTLICEVLYQVFLFIPMVITLNNQPKSHPKCKSNYFVIPSSVPQNRREMLLSRLLTAYAMKEKVNIGYDNSVECANSYIKVHRVG